MLKIDLPNLWNHPRKIEVFDFSHEKVYLTASIGCILVLFLIREVWWYKYNLVSIFTEFSSFYIAKGGGGFQEIIFENTTFFDGFRAWRMPKNSRKKWYFCACGACFGRYSAICTLSAPQAKIWAFLVSVLLYIDAEDTHKIRHFSRNCENFGVLVYLLAPQAEFSRFWPFLVIPDRPNWIFLWIKVWAWALGFGSDTFASRCLLDKKFQIFVGPFWTCKLRVFGISEILKSPKITIFSKIDRIRRELRKNEVF